MSVTNCYYRVSFSFWQVLFYNFSKVFKKPFHIHKSGVTTRDPIACAPPEKTHSLRIPSKAAGYNNFTMKSEHQVFFHTAGVTSISIG